MNAAELSTAITVLGCPAAAVLAAASEKAGWFTVLFVAVGLAIGVAAGYGVRLLAGLLLAAAGGSHSRAWVGWTLLFAYTIVPMALAVGGILIICGITVWMVRHLL